MASIECLSTVFDRRYRVCSESIGNTWSRRHYGGDFGLIDRDHDETAISLVFVQTKDGNTGGSDPSALGGGATDTHLLYEGLTRVAADAVLSGAGSLHTDSFFSVWHPELVWLRASLGLPRHPAQVIVSKRGAFDMEALLFNVTDARVFLIAGDECLTRHRSALHARPWMQILPFDGVNLRPAIEQLRLTEGIQRISAVGGRSTATRLVDGGVVQDIYLTTTSHTGGEPDTAWYTGSHTPPLTVITEKQWLEHRSRVVFDHLLIG